MEEKEIKNAIIKSASITVESRDILTVWLELDYGSSCQNFGGYSLLLGIDYKHYQDSLKSNFAGLFIRKCLDIADAQDWSKLPGKSIRVDSSFSNVDGIGHITKNLWFYPRLELANLNKIKEVEK
jgi:hypothetical protein